MKIFLALLLAASSAPALAQHQGRGQHGAHHPRPKATPQRRARPAPQRARPAQRATRPAQRAVRPAAPRRRAPARRPAPAPADSHAGHSAPQPQQQTDPHAGHAPPPAEQQADPHAGHSASPAPEQQADPHAGHAPAPHSPAPPAAPPPAEALTGPAHAADQVYGEAEMRRARAGMDAEHGDIVTSRFMIDRLEARTAHGGGYEFDGQFWWGGDIDRLWLESEVEGELGERPGRVELQALWSHAIDPWFDLQLGLRHDFRPDPERSFLVAGVQGMAPYMFELDAALFLSHRGELTARIEGEYDWRLTQRLILQPALELDFSLQDVPELGLGSGVTSIEPSLRLRYEIVPEFAPYVGLSYERSLGRTAGFSRRAGEEPGAWSFVLGIRSWF